MVARAVVNGLQERFAHRAATRVVAELREQVVARAAALGPRWLASGRGTDVVTLATRGLDALEPYLVRYANVVDPHPGRLCAGPPGIGFAV